jgi:hypothetical protein
MSKQQFEAELQQKLAELSKDKQAERDLWQGIELALASQETPMQLERPGPLVAGSKLYAMAATFAVFAMFGWMVVNQQSQALVGDSLVAALSEQHQQQKNALLVKFQDQPALTQNWQEQLDELDEAAVAIKSALENEPNNMALLKMLQAVHQQQINLIERVHSAKWSQI